MLGHGRGLTPAMSGKVTAAGTRRATTTGAAADLDALDLLGCPGRTRVEARRPLELRPCSIRSRRPTRSGRAGAGRTGDGQRPSPIAGSSATPLDGADCAPSSDCRRHAPKQWNPGLESISSCEVRPQRRHLFGRPQGDVDERRPEVVPVHRKLRLDAEDPEHVVRTLVRTPTRHRLRHPAERDARPLALEQHGHRCPPPSRA